MTQFKVGDKVKLKQHGLIGWETMHWTEIEGLTDEEEYEIEHDEDDYFQDLTKAVRLVGHRFYYHPDHFTLSTTNTHDKQ